MRREDCLYNYVSVISVNYGGAFVTVRFYQHESGDRIILEQ
jgi:hypothetical protein